MKTSVNVNVWILSVVSALLLSIPYTIPHTGMIALIALVPLLAAEYIAREAGKRYFFVVSYLCFFLWNCITTYWIYLATLPGAIAAILLNSLQMAVVFAFFRFCRKRTKGFIPYVALAFLWVGWEHLYQTWQVTWPWLNLGNAFASSIKSIQWYSLTGTLGGSLWIILINALVFNILKNITLRKSVRLYSLILAALVIIPITYSHIRYYTYPPYGEDKREVVIVQPNIDPYNDKFASLTQYQQDSIYFSIARENITTRTTFLLAPETFVGAEQNHVLTENMPDRNYSFIRFKNFAEHNNLNVIFGAVTQRVYIQDPATFNWKNYKQQPAPTPTARSIGPSTWYDNFNTAVFIARLGNWDFYHKSKLVILAESTPIINGKSALKFLGIDLGGEFGNFGTQKERSTFKIEDGTTTGVAICYESVFGDFFRGYIKNGADFMTIITNDGWWGNTFGYRQHLSYASLRAIETRRDIARCANTGISAFINQRGEITSRTGWWEKGALRGDVTLNQTITPFVKMGDVVGGASVWLGLVALLYAIGAGFLKRKGAK